MTSATPSHVQALVVGAGPAGLAAAEALALAGARTLIIDGARAPARKFLLAGRGGLNLTHSEALEPFLTRYADAAPALRPALEAFPPDHLRAWSAELGEETFVGSSGRVFPKSFKATKLLRAWLRRLDGLGVQLRLRHRLVGIDADRTMRVMTPEGEIVLSADCVVLALGGASWPHLGADGAWTSALERLGIAVAPLKPSNCGFSVAWSEHMRAFAGTPLKNVVITFGARSARGEAMIVEGGIEGGAIYALSRTLREAIERSGEATPVFDLKPDVTLDALAARLAAKPGETLSTRLRKRGRLDAVAIALLREAGPLPGDPAALAARVKACGVTLSGVAPIARAISSAGGIAWSEIDDTLMLRKLPGVFVAGEMIDWEAPTGGYLLQACFSLGRAAGSAAARWRAHAVNAGNWPQ